MKSKSLSYTFWGLVRDGTPIDTPVDSLAYLIALVESVDNQIMDLEKAKFVIRYLFDVEEQVESAAELIAVQENSCPSGFFPQTPVMLTLKWCPIASLLDNGFHPMTLERENRLMACASGMWDIEPNKADELRGCEVKQEKLFWDIVGKVARKARLRKQYISITVKPGWSYESNIGRPNNLSLSEAESADRVVWSRTPE